MQSPEIKGLKQGDPMVVVKYMGRKNKTKQKNEQNFPNMSCMSLSGPDCWVNWFRKLIDIKAGGEARGHSFSSRICLF